jgi:hypothetical protein
VDSPARADPCQERRSASQRPGPQAAVDTMLYAMSMQPLEIVRSERKAWGALHLGLVFAAHALDNGNADLVAVAKAAVETMDRAGYKLGTDYGRTPRNEIAKWQDRLYALNELQGWRFSDDVLLTAWLIECGGPSMGRGPATANYEISVENYIAGTRQRYNTRTQGHDRGDGPESVKYRLPASYSLQGTR